MTRMQEDGAGVAIADDNRRLFDAEAAARLRRVIGRLARAMNPSAATEDLTPTQASVLGVVVAHGRVRVSVVAELEGLNPTMVSRVLGRLEDLGLLHRVPDAEDQRAVLAVATAAGREKNDRIREARVTALLDVVDGLPVTTVETLAAALPALEEFTDVLRGVTPPRSV
ncbi:MAG: MarR family transcriptional regulator [Pseudonocardia sp.]|nr:MarR family transcriptional regulator [Pseudonocardia sp.]